MYVQSVSEDQSGMRIGMGMGVVDMDMEAGVGEGCAPAASARSTYAALVEVASPTLLRLFQWMWMHACASA